MIFKEFMRWLPDEKPLSTEAVVVVSACGSVVKRLPYVKWCKINNSYSTMKEYVYKQSFNRGKQRYDSVDKIEKHGRYRHVEINGKVFAVHRIVALAHIPNPDNKPLINHINGVRDDNRSVNLEWATNADNIKHSWNIGLSSAEKRIKLKDEDMPDVVRLKKEGFSNKEIGKIYSVTGETIRARLKIYENSFCS